MRASTIDSIQTVLHKVFDMAVDDDYIHYNPADKALKEIKKTKLYKNPKRIGLTYEEETIFLNFIENSGRWKRYYPIFLTMAKTGMQSGEIPSPS